MALSKIQAESMNLADTYAFTGTVTGTPTGALTKIYTNTLTSDASWIALDNVFSSTYHSYRILLKYVVTANAQIRWRLRSGGGQNVTNYWNTRHRKDQGDTGWAGYSDNGTGTIDRWDLMGGYEVPNLYHITFAIDVIGPYSPERTMFVAKGVGYNGSQGVFFDSYGIHNNTSNFDGFNFYASAGNARTDTRIELYGYNY